MILDRSELLRHIISGTLIVFSLVCIILVYAEAMGFDFQFKQNSYLAELVLFSYLIVCWMLYRSRYFTSVSWAITLLYFVIATLISIEWGINTPAALLTYGLSILLVALLLGTKWLFIASAIIVASLIVQQAVVSFQPSILMPHYPQESTFVDLGIYTLMFTVFVYLVWLASRQIQTSHHVLRRTQQILQKQRDQANTKLQLEKRKLHQAQIEDVSQMYMFAELGQQTTLVLHDLANQIAILSLGDNITSEINLTESRDTINKIEKLIEKANSQIKPVPKIDFDILPVINDAITAHTDQAQKQKVTLHQISKIQKAKIHGSTNQLQQVLSILIKNSLEAHGNNEDTIKKYISVTSRNINGSVVISVTDNAGGLGNNKKDSIFNGVQSTKQTGHGLGLYIARLVTENHFQGKISCTSKRRVTKFTCVLPASLQTK